MGIGIRGAIGVRFLYLERAGETSASRKVGGGFVVSKSVESEEGLILKEVTLLERIAGTLVLFNIFTPGKKRWEHESTHAPSYLWFLQASN